MDTSAIEHFLLNGAHKVPIYFTTELSGFPFGFSNLRTARVPPNSLRTKTLLQNIVGVMNSSTSAKTERIILITVPFDTFSAAPTLGVGFNSSGIAITAVLETMRLVSKFPLVDEWVLIFAVTDGRFCGFEGLIRLVQSFSSELKSRVEFAVSIDSILSKTIHGRFANLIKPNSSFFQFIESLIQSLRVVGIEFDAEINGQSKIFASAAIESLSIDGEILTSVTDSRPDILRSDSFAWAFSEALLRTIYSAHRDTSLIDKMQVDTSIWAKIIGRMPRVAPFRDPAIARVIAQWMGKFAQVSVDEWGSTHCFTPYTATEAVMVLYNPAPMKVYLGLYCIGFVYGLLVFMAIARHKILRMLDEQSIN
jgi:hypothetical protein